MFLASVYSLLTRSFLYPTDFAVQDALIVAFSRLPEWQIIFWETLASAGSLVPTAVAIILGVIYFRRKCFEHFLLIVIAYGGGMLLFIALAFLFNRERPDLPGLLSVLPFPSFPSGHMMQATTLILPLLILFLPKIKSTFWRVVILVLALVYFPLIGYDRILTNAHYLTDVTAGFGIGLVWAIVVLLFFERRHLKKQYFVKQP